MRMLGIFEGWVGYIVTGAVMLRLALFDLPDGPGKASILWLIGATGMILITLDI